MCCRTPATVRAPPDTFTTTSGTRRTVRAMCSFWAGVRDLPPRPYETMSRSGTRSRRSMTRFFITGPPTRKVPVDEQFDVIAQAVERSHQGLRIGSGHASHLRPAVERVGNLIQIPTDRTDLGDAALECRKLKGWHRCARPQVRTDQERHVGARRHLTPLGAFAQEQ